MKNTTCKKHFSILLFIIMGVGGLPSVHAQNSIVLTFDDTYIEEWASIRPMLDELGVKATFYISNYYTFNGYQRSLVQDLFSDGHEIASHTRDHARASVYCPKGMPSCNITHQERAEYYVNEQVLPQLTEFANDGLYPRNFAYPGGSWWPETNALLKQQFGYVRRTTNYANRQTAYVSCGDDRFIAGLGIDYVYGVSGSEFEAAMDATIASNSNLVWYGHRIENYPEGNYNTGRERLRELIKLAQSKGLSFRRVRDICSWQASTAGGAWVNIYDSPREHDELVFADFNGDGADDVFRKNGRTWEVLYSQIGGLDSEAPWQYLNTSGVDLKDLTLSDFDGDGQADIFRSTNGRWYISYSGTESWVEVQNSGVHPSRLRYADFDGDGGTDVFVQFGAKWYVSRNARSSWSLINNISLYDIEQFRFGDFDGDGKSDIFVSSGGKWLVSYGGTTQWTQLNTSGYGVPHLAFADVNGDGKTDVIRTTGSRWYVSYSGSTRWTLLKLSTNTLDNLSFADLDGDGIDEALRVASKLP